MDAEGNQGTPLIVSARHGMIEACRSLLSHEVDLLRKDKEGWTAIHWAAATNRVEIIELLLAKRPSLIDVEGDEDTPLTVSARSGSIETCKCLLFHGADLSRKTKYWTAMHAAALYDSFKVVELFLSVRPSLVNDRLSNGLTPLHYSTSPPKASAQSTRLLLLAGADTKATTHDWKQTALHLAAEKGSTSALKVLLDFGASIGARDSNGWTALHLAVYSGRTQCVEILLQRGANPLANNNDGKKASEVGHWKPGESGHLRPDSRDSVAQCQALLREVEEKAWRA